MIYSGLLVGRIQIRILRYVWQRGRCTIRQIHAAIGNEPGKPVIPKKSVDRLCRFLVTRRLLRQYPEMRFEEHVPGRLPVSFDAIIPGPEYEHGMAKWILDSYYNGDLEQFHAALKPVVSDATETVPTVRLAPDQFSTDRDTRLCPPEQTEDPNENDPKEAQGI